MNRVNVQHLTWCGQKSSAESNSFQSPSKFVSCLHAGTSYQFLSESLNYQNAINLCAEFGMTLFQPKSESVIKIIGNVAQKWADISESWIGLNDYEEEGVFKYLIDDTIGQFHTAFKILRCAYPTNDIGFCLLKLLVRYQIENFPW